MFYFCLSIFDYTMQLGTFFMHCRLCYMENLQGKTQSKVGEASRGGVAEAARNTAVPRAAEPAATTDYTVRTT